MIGRRVEKNYHNVTKTFKRMNRQLDVKRRTQLSEIWLIFVTYLGKIKDQHNRSVRFEKR